MVTVEYASELDPLLEVTLPSDWLVAIVLKPGQLLADSDRPEDRLLGQLLSGGDDQRIIASQVAFLYYRGIDPDPDAPTRGNQISVKYDFENAQYELSSVLAETTVSTVDAAVDWVDEQFLATETFVETSLTLMRVAEDIHGLGRTGIRGLVETFETLEGIREANVDALADVPYVDGENATALQAALEDADAIEASHPTPLEQELGTVDGPLILDLQRGPVPGELLPTGASEPKYSSKAFGGTESDRR
ncbi:helix-hairpin-helix domain-containing protein [Saliphagus infecundisoli]|uniref:Helix-hairpin-helix domain-containing protein n=1 Tax=Saliphagus infecundisoli TaxID=1849069 RepID=A0ABD5QCK8_9EURY|nr:helix-hairpin-helix domain-containing protein [Saliphagus infecundisoli]